MAQKRSSRTMTGVTLASEVRPRTSAASSAAAASPASARAHRNRLLRFRRMLEGIERVVELSRSHDVEGARARSGPRPPGHRCAHLSKAPREPAIALGRVLLRRRSPPRLDDRADERARGARQRTLLEPRDLLVDEPREELLLEGGREEWPATARRKVLGSRRERRLHRREPARTRLERERIDRPVDYRERRILREHRAHREVPEVLLGAGPRARAWRRADRSPPACGGRSSLTAWNRARRPAASSFEEGVSTFAGAGPQPTTQGSTRPARASLNRRDGTLRSPGSSR